MNPATRERTQNPMNLDARFESEEPRRTRGEFPGGRTVPVALAALLGLGILCGGCAPRVQPGTTIASIQGAGHVSPLKDARVDRVEGVVTAVLEDERPPRFWIQSRRPDDSPATSEGLMVLTRGVDVPMPAVGSLVAVSGTVSEWSRGGELTQTELADPAWEILGQAELPAPVLIPGHRNPPGVVDDDGLSRFEPRSDAIDFWESLEGMLVEIQDPVVIGPTSRYGDAVVISGPDWHRVSEKTARGGVRVMPDDENPEKVVIDGRIIGGVPDFRVGERLRGNVRGIVSQEFGIQRVLLVEKPESLGPVGWASETTRLTGGPDSVTIASWNVLNLAATNPPLKFEGIARVIVEHLRSPDIIGLQEIQDDSGGRDDGITSARATLERLVAAISDAGGPEYAVRQIDPLDSADGGAPGSNIRNAFLFNPDRVSFPDRGEPGAETEAALAVSGGEILQTNPARLGTREPCFLGEGSSDEAEGTRKSLVGEFELGGKRIVVINNHLKSKRGDDAVFGPVQPPVRHTEAQRSCQTALIGEFVERIRSRFPVAAVVVLGDLNEYEFRPPIDELRKRGLVALVDRHPGQDRYTYNYQGNSQILDHILVPRELASRTELDIVHVTVDEPGSLQTSDHEPLLVRVRLD
ncbi:MAG: endonuclease/exonuclease/phosphatase family protein [Acidobacteria bacterium]|nr:endonuclease/exonuclease/phosphatase family protein [Acidobacteriota bacterium]